MIYFLSDFHGGTRRKGLDAYLRESHEDDLLIVLGDVGLHFAETEGYEDFTKFFLSIDKDIAIVDGNHENFDFLYSFPEEEWNGGNIHRLTEHIVHLKRGHVFTLEGDTFFVFGGCKSSPKWKKMGLWYPQEEQSLEEFTLAYENLAKHNYQVDYVLTHKYDKRETGTEKNSLQGLTDFMDENVQFTAWYAGHWHREETIDDKHFLVYDRPVPLKK